MKNNKAFTLVEIMTVTFIIALLLSMALIEGVKLKKAANESNCMGNLKTIASAFEVYAASHTGAYAPGEETSLQFLVDEKCLSQDLVSIGRLGNFNYSIGYVDSSGYDIRAIAASTSLADHNYQITNGGALKRSDSANSGDIDFKFF